MNGDEIYRYSNTLLVSFNNRILIREAAATREAAITPPAETFVTPRSEGSMDTIVMRPPAAYRARPLADNKRHERVVVREWGGFSLRLRLTRAQLADVS
jgi:hypothetical protein